METRHLSNGRVEIWTDDAHVIRKKGDSAPTGIRRRQIKATELDNWEEVTVEEAEASSRRAETEERYRRRVTERIRERYDLDAELAIQRQRDTKPEEFAQFNAYAEECKAAVRAEINAQYSLDDALNDDE